MELLVLMFAMFIRAMFLKPTGWLNIQQGLNLFINSFVREDSTRLNLLLAAFIVINLVVYLFFGKYFISLLEVLLFLYLFFVLHENFPKIWAEKEISHTDLIEKIKLYEPDYEETDQSYEKLSKTFYSLWLYGFFTSTFVLIFWYLVAGWIGLLTYALTYYIKFDKVPFWLVLLRQFLEIPAGILSAVSCAVAGRMDSVIAALLAWKMHDFENGRHIFETSVSASTEIEFEQKYFYKKLHSCKRLSLRSVYVWFFVIALILIV